jgi:hypothetical protein
MEGAPPPEPLIQVWGIPGGLKQGWLNPVSFILRAPATDVNSHAKNDTIKSTPV